MYEAGRKHEKRVGLGLEGFFQWRGVTERGLGNIGLGELEF